MKKVFEEIGKHFLNIGVAIVVFAILQLIIKGKFDIKISFIFGLIYLVIVLVSAILIAVGGESNE